MGIVTSWPLIVCDSPELLRSLVSCFLFGHLALGLVGCWNVLPWLMCSVILPCPPAFLPLPLCLNYLWLYLWLAVNARLFILEKHGIASVLWWCGDTGEERGVMGGSGGKMASTSKFGAGDAGCLGVGGWRWSFTC